jgi:diguanylate cyclase (GGDEF)-like protein
MIFARLGGDDGLSHGAITAIVQDARGFLWFGTEDGLDRYDGYELRHYFHNDWISALARDPRGSLWAGSDGGGVVWRDEAGGFRTPATAESMHNTEDRVRALHVDRSGQLWVATRNSGVTLHAADRKLVREFRHDAADPNSLSNDSVFAITQDLSGHIWIGTANGLDRVDPKSGLIERFGERLRLAGAPADAPLKVNALIVDTAGTLWIGLEFGLARLPASGTQFKLLRPRVGDSSGLPDGHITALLEDQDRRLWVGTTSGLALRNNHSDDFVVLRHDPTNPSSLPDSYITSLYQDRSGLLWVGTKTGGAARWNPRSWFFGTEGADNVTSFSMDSKSRLWVGSFGGGVASIDPVSGAVKRYRSGPSHGKRARPGTVLRDDTVMALVTDTRDRVWIGTMSHGVERLDPAHGDIAHFDFNANDVESLPAAGVMTLLHDSRGGIWVGTYGGGLAHIDSQSGRVRRYAHGRYDASGLSGDRATALAEGLDGLIWIGTDGNGLDVLNPASGRFAHFVHDPHDQNSLAANTVYAVHADDRGTIWVGMRGGGLDRVTGTPFSGEALRFDNFSQHEGLPNSTVYGIESDASGKLWVSTNRGLAAVSPSDHSVRAFRRSHGLQGDEFNFGAHYRAGVLYFGGTNGYNAFLPERLRLNENPPQIVLTDVLKLNKPATQSPEILRELNLGYRDTMVTFQFAALDFTGPSLNRYSYRLEGFDGDWVDAGTARTATYTNLDGGDYVFRVRAANNDGRWNENPLSVNVHVAPQPWATWWARAAYGTALFAVVFLVWFAQYRRVLREAAYARRLREEVASRTEELAERNQDMEFANERLREASVSDSLTGLGNRRRLHEVMAAPDGPSAARLLVFMVVDLDHLKPINDQYGHEGGDAVLVQVANILRREFRPNDLIVRWGGDEFVIMCRDVDLVTAAALADRVRSAVAKQIFSVGAGRVARTSCSIGFAPVPFIPSHPELINWEQSLQLADSALYKAKRDRNSWVGWGGTDKAAELPRLTTILPAEAATLERDGYLIVVRRPWNPEDTVDRLRTARQPT